MEHSMYENRVSVTETQSENSWYFSHDVRTGEFIAIEPDSTLHHLNTDLNGGLFSDEMKFNKLFNRMIQDLSKS